ncbi:MAG: N-formylglutamate amidohydrolase, partial [Syntrophaceae bacterium]
ARARQARPELKHAMSIPCDPERMEQLRSAKRLEGKGAGGGFAFELDLSTPALAVAIHAGHNVRTELHPLMQIPEKDRLFEEDPATDRMIRGTANAIWGLDSRAEYDLNRTAGQAVPLTAEQFWGVQVYRKAPTQDMVCRSLEKYDAFYLFIGSCIRILLERFGFCVVYDIHSYNLSRQVEKGISNPPVFNLGTALLDRPRWGERIDAWLDELGRIEVQGIRTTVEENRVFSGAGEFCRRLTGWDRNILVLPTEIAKVYMDERTGALHEPLIDAIGRGLRRAIAAHTPPKVR